MYNVLSYHFNNLLVHALQVSLRRAKSARADEQSNPAKKTLRAGLGYSIW